MANRITDKMLDVKVAEINELTGSPVTPYVGGKAQIGNYHVSHCYGGVALHRMFNEGGGVTTPFGCGHSTKRELFDKMSAFIAGIRAARGE